MKAVNYQIEMLSVGTADAFIIFFIDEKQNGHLILVDAGNYSDGQTIIDHIRKYYTNPVIDLAIVTHPDDDHYGGFIKILEKIRDKAKDAIKINKFWVNDPGNNHIDKNEVKWITKQRSVNVKARTVYDLGEKNLIDIIDSIPIPREEKFAKTKTFTLGPNYPTTHYIPYEDSFPIRIIGPTKEYYEQLVPNFRNDNLNFFTKEDDDDYFPSRDKPNEKCLSPTLDNAPDDTSAHNQSSLIILFEPSADKKYLFMGDAGRDAFTNITYRAKECIKNVSWLKVPHHGSKHNIHSNIINWIKPKTAYISTEGIGNYLNQCTINALKASKCDVYSTHKEQSHFIHNQIWDREGYSTATPL
jgi:beta-lactamase superfamily II metal-dependent hydrolase